VWFHRIINGLESSDDGDNDEVLKYTDHCPDGLCLNDSTHPQALLHSLKNKKMKEVMNVENIFTYDATWTPKGNNYNDLNVILKMMETFSILSCKTRTRVTLANHKGHRQHNKPMKI